ncbi:SDR family NAD(P)-dependent oxidoreductase [Actinocrispum sp. NPDC049592]|uniref:SDR family oxidoreductase n=1 Tax=Actinocrispum sp. NPDC049592 TaxID=3154835 RepID=UPI00342C07C5
MSGRPLDGAVALITGATSEIGAATAQRLAREGAAVALVARQQNRLDRVANDVRTLGGHAIAVPADITSPRLARQAVEDTHDRLGRLDILVNNAGVMVLGTALHAPIADWDQMISLNVSALLHVTHAAVPYLIDAAATSPRRVADLVNIGSTAGRVAQPGGSVHTLTRFGLTGFTESLRQELRAEHIRVGVVQPGTEPVPPQDIADAIAYAVTRDRRVAVTEMVVRADQV